MAFEQGQVQLTLRREVLVKHRLADVGGLGDLVHGGAVVAVGHKNFLRCGKELGASFVPGKPGGPLPGGARAVCGSAATGEPIPVLHGPQLSFFRLQLTPLYFGGNMTGGIPGHTLKYGFDIHRKCFRSFTGSAG
jgi:hypothetical protein